MKSADLGKIFPRLYALLPRVGETDLTLKQKDSPVGTRLAGDVIIFYGCDMGSSYQIIAERHLDDLQMTKEEMHEIAVKNLSNIQKEIRLQKGDNFSFITCDGDLEASLLLHRGIWDYVADQVGGDVVASVPARNVLLVSGTRKVELSALKKKTCECLEMAPKPLSLKLFLRVEKNWQEYKV